LDLIIETEVLTPQLDCSTLRGLGSADADLRPLPRPRRGRCFDYGDLPLAIAVAASGAVLPGVYTDGIRLLIARNWGRSWACGSGQAYRCANKPKVRG